MKRHLQAEKGRARDSKELSPQGGYLGGGGRQRVKVLEQKSLSQISELKIAYAGVGDKV